MEEIWKEIPGFEGLYSISNLGRVRNDKRHGKIKSGYFYKKTGQTLVILYKNNIEYAKSVSQLVAQAFLPNPDNYSTVIHIGNRDDNSVTNLKWHCKNHNGDKMNCGRKAIKVRCKDDGLVFDSMHKCAEYYHLPYKEFCRDFDELYSLQFEIVK